MLKLSYSFQDMNFISKARIVSPNGIIYKAYNMLGPDRAIKIVEDILNNTPVLFRRMKVVKEGAPKLSIVLLPEFDKCLFFVENEKRYYCNLKSDRIFDFEDDNFAENWTYDITNSMQ